VSAVNDCGNSDFSPELSVSVGNTFGISENTTGIGLEILPNPNSGSFTLNMTYPGKIKFDILIFNTFGEQIVKMYGIHCDERLSMPVNLSGISEGVYYLNIRTKKALINRTILINK
jgi:hypothetical protein